MPTIQHPDIRPVSGDPTAGPHVIHYWEVADNTARDALTLVANDIGRVCRVGSAAPYTFFVLINNTGPAWDELGGSGGSGDVVGPASATDNAVARFNLTTGKLIQNSALIVDDSGNVSTSGTLASGALTVTGSITVSSTVDGRDVATDGAKLDGIEAGADVTDATNVAAAGAVMSGASATGDLGGTFPGPTVTQARGLRETAGPTTLAMGAVADAQLLARSGSSVVGRDFSRTEVRVVSSANATLALTDEILQMSLGGADREVQLPSVTTDAECGFLIQKISTGTNSITLIRAASESIMGAASNYVLPGSTGTGLPAWYVYRDASGNWWVA